MKVRVVTLAARKLYASLDRADAIIEGWPRLINSDTNWVPHTSVLRVGVLIFSRSTSFTFFSQDLPLSRPASPFLNFNLQLVT
jgi:hypothetical protein